MSDAPTALSRLALSALVATVTGVTMAVTGLLLRESPAPNFLTALAWTIAMGAFSGCVIGTPLGFALLSIMARYATPRLIPLLLFTVCAGVASAVMIVELRVESGSVAWVALIAGPLGGAVIATIAARIVNRT